MIQLVLTIVSASLLLYGIYNFQKITYQNLGAPTYSEILAIDVLQYSKTAYCTADQIKNCNTAPCNRHNMKDITVFYNSSYSSQGYAGYDAGNNRIVVAFRGTVDVNNWMQDGDASHTAYKACTNCQLHNGFLQTYNSIAIQLLNTIQTLTAKYPSGKIYVTGHSLGASLATIAAGELHLNGYPIDTFINFASPRTGNKAYAEWFNKIVSPNAIRVTHYRDPVVHCPMESQGYYHISNEVFYTNEASTKYVICNGGEDPKCADNYVGVYVGDHTTYIRQSTDCN